MVDWLEAVDEEGELEFVVTSFEGDSLDPVESFEVTAVIGL